MADATLGTATLRTSLDSSGLNRGLSQARGQTNQTFNTLDARMRQTGQRMTRFGQTMSLAVTAPIVGLGVAAVRTAGQFEESMNRVRAITGAAGEDFERLRGLAADLGESTAFSASEAADGMGFLAQAGFEVDEIMSALPGTLELAAAGQLDLARAADLASNVLSGFGLEASEIGRVNDTMAATASSANTSVSQLGRAMSFAAPVAAGMGVSVEEASAAVGLLSNAGIQGERAGTALRGILGQLSQNADELGISMRDAQGNMLPVVEILEQLEAQGFTAQDAIESVGLEAGPALQALLSQGSGALRELTEELENAEGTAGRMADTQMEGLNGQLKELRSAAEGLAIAVGDAGLLEAVTNLAEGATTLVRRFGELDEGTQTMIVRGAALAAAIGPISLALGKIVTVAPRVVGALRAIRVAALPILGPAGLIAGGILLIDEISGALSGNGSSLRNRLNEAGDAFDDFYDAIENRQNVLENFRDLVSSVNPFDVFQGRGEREFLESIGADPDALDRLYGTESTPGSSMGISAPAGRDTSGGAGGRGGSADARETPLSEDAETAEDSLESLQQRLSEPVDLGGSERTVADVFDDLAEAGTNAERRAAAFGGTLDERLQSVETRAGLVSNAIDELFTLGLTATDDRVQYLVGRLEELQEQAERLRSGVQVDTGSTSPLSLGTGVTAGAFGQPDLPDEDLADAVYRGHRDAMTRALEGGTRPTDVQRQQPLGITDLMLDPSVSTSDLVERILNQALRDASENLQAQLAQQQGGLGVPQSTEDLEAFNQELRDTTEAEALAAGAMTEVEREARAAAAGAREFAASVRQAEHEQDVLNRIQRQGRLDASPNLQARLAQQQGALGVGQSAEDLDDFNAQLAETAAAEAEAAGAMTDFEREVREATAGARSFAAGLRQAESDRVLTARIQRQQLIAGSPDLQARLAQQQGQAGAPQSQEDRDAFQADVEALEARRQAEEDATAETDRLTRTFNRLDAVASSRNLQIALSRGQGGPTPEGLAATPEPMDPSVFDADPVEQTRLEQGMSPDDFGQFQSDIIQANQEAAEIERQSAEDFADKVINAGGSIADIITGLASGDLSAGGAISGIGQTIGSFIPGPWGTAVSVGSGILGGIVDAFSGGGDDQEEQRREEERRRSRNVPAVTIQFQFDQVNHYQGSPQMPQVEQAFRRQANIAIEEFMNRTKLVQRVEALGG